MLDRIIVHIQAHQRSYLITLLAITIFLGLCASGISVGGRQIMPGLRVDNSMEVWFRQDDPDWLKYRRFQKHFEGDEFVVIAFEEENIFEPRVLRKIKDLTEKLGELPHVSKVTSLTNVDDFRGGDGVLTISELVEQVPDDPVELERLRDRALRQPLYTGNVISSDGRTTGILVEVEPAPKGNNYQRKLTDLIYDLCERESEKGSYRFQIAGTTILLGLEDKASTDDAVLEFFLALALLIGVLYLTHHRWMLVIIPLTVVTITNIWIHGIIALCGSTYNMVFGVLPAMVMVLGIADAIHYMNEYRLQRDRGADGLSAVRRTFCLVFVPCLFTSVTNSVGFGSMAVSHLRPVSEFGIYAGLAMLLAFVVNMVLISIWLGRLKRIPADIRPLRVRELLARLVEKTTTLTRRHVRVNIFIAFLVFLVSFTGIRKIEINTHEIKYFRKSHPIRVATEFIERTLTGTIPLEIMLSGPPDAFKEPATLSRIETMQSFLATLPQFQKTFSLVDYLKEINRVVHDEDPAHYRIPETREAVAQLLLLAEENIEDYADVNDYSVARIHSRFNYVDTRQARRIQEDVNRKLSEIFASSGIEVEVTGSIPMYLNAERYILDSQIRGFSSALLVIFLIISILVRSLKLGLIAMVPNVIPIALTFGLMGWTHIYLDMGTVLIASIAIGLAVDDTIHLLSRFRISFQRRRNYEEALDETFQEVGVPVVITSVVLFFGFAILVVSTFMPVVYFGITAAITMLSAMIAELFVTPALIKLFKPFGPEEVP